MKGIIHSYESLAAADGKGLRYAVFFAGCPLRCVCCHNPDTWSMTGMEISAQELVNKISRYKTYFKDRGGATFSGGEPLMQAEFIEEMIPLLSEEEIKYAIDTSGAVELTDCVKRVLDNSQTVILDLKFWDEESYRKYTGSGIGNTLDMLSYLEKTRKNTWIRTVVIPGINDSEECMEKYLKHLHGLTCLERYELLPFHTMGFFKYEKLGIKNPLINTKPLDNADSLQAYVDKTLF